MSANTSIEWCDHSWNPWRGCTKVSPGCLNCYAERLAKRNPKVLGSWGKGAPRVLAKNWGDPVRWQTKHLEQCSEWMDAKSELHDIGRFVPGAPKQPKVFPSLCDWLDEEVPMEWLASFMCLIHDTPNIDWLLLTKRPELWNSRKWALESAIVSKMKSECDSLIGKASYSKVRDKWFDRSHWFSDWIRNEPPRNVWVGTSVEDQQRADERIPALQAIPAKLRFLSVEPLLGLVDIRYSAFNGVDSCAKIHGIDWVIVGGESGPKSRPCNVDWIRSIVRQCNEANVPCFVKQLGARPVGRWTESPKKSGIGEGWPAGLKIKHPKGGDAAEWPEDLRVRQFPEVKL